MSNELHLIREGLIKRIHVDRHVLARNKKQGEQAPAITIQLSTGPIKASQVNIYGPSYVIHDEDRPLSCGARVWIVTHAEVAYMP